LQLMGRLKSGLPRLPLAPMDEVNLAELRTELTALGLLG